MTLTKTTISGFAVGSAVVFAGGPDSTVGKTALIAPLDTPSVVSQLKPVDSGEANMEPLETQMQFEVQPMRPKWTPANARKFHQLAIKRAHQEATPEEESQFTQLQRLRRAVVASSAGVDVLSEWKRRRFVNELLALLSRNATFFTAADQKKLRTFGKTARQ